MHNIINDKSLVLGIMSGTSMDGLDISCSRYYKKNNDWFIGDVSDKTIDKTETHTYKDIKYNEIILKLSDGGKSFKDLFM